MNNNKCLSSCWCCMHPSSISSRACLSGFPTSGKNVSQLLFSLSLSLFLSFAASCTVGIKRGRIFYNSKKLWIADLKPNRVFHGEHVAFYCLNKADRCGYPVASTCQDGSLPIPECFEGVHLPVLMFLTSGCYFLFLQTQGPKTLQSTLQSYVIYNEVDCAFLFCELLHLKCTSLIQDIVISFSIFRTRQD